MPLINDYNNIKYIEHNGNKITKIYDWWRTTRLYAWYIPPQPPTPEEILFEWPNWKIIHHIEEQSIELRPTVWESIFIADRNLWATEYLWQSSDETKAYWDYYRWWAIVPWIEWWTDYHSDQDFAERRDLWEQSIVPSWWCIPDVDYVKRAIDLTREITWNVRWWRSQWLIPYAWFWYYIDSRWEIDWNYVWTGPAYFYLASLTYDWSPAPQLYMNKSSSGNNYLVLRDLTTAGNPWYLPIRPFKKISNT